MPNTSEPLFQFKSLVGTGLIKRRKYVPPLPGVVAQLVATLQEIIDYTTNSEVRQFAMAELYALNLPVTRQVYPPDDREYNFPHVPERCLLPGKEAATSDD